jgi:hypothetical protein
MTRLLILPATVLCLALAACGSHVEVKVTQNAISRIELFNAAGMPSSEPVSQPDRPGAVNMHVHEQRLFSVTRTITESSGHRTFQDVTRRCSFTYTNPAVAAMDVAGQLTAFQPGFTIVEVSYQEDRLDPTAADKVRLDVTVLP